MCGSSLEGRDLMSHVKFKGGETCRMSSLKNIHVTCHLMSVPSAAMSLECSYVTSFTSGVLSIAFNHDMLDFIKAPCSCLKCRGLQ